MRVGLDGTPLLGPRTGIGRYVEGLLGGLAGGPDELVLTAFTWRGAGSLHEVPGVEVRHRRAPARGLQQLWGRLPWPPLEMIAGRVDVFHATNYVLPPSRRAAGVLSVHDLTFLHHPDTVQTATARFRHLVPVSLRRAHAVCVLSQTVAEEVAAEYAVDPARIVVTRPGVGPSFHAARPASAEWLASRGLPTEFAVFVGSREPRKGLPTLLAAWARLWETGAAPPLCLVGPPGWGPALDLAGLPPAAVVMPGYLPDEDLPAVLASAVLLTMPSRYEGYGIPPVEALATGTPVVVSDLPVFREVLGDYARYAAVEDVDALASALADVIAAGRGTREDQERRRRHTLPLTWDACAAEARRAYRIAAAG